MLGQDHLGHDGRFVPSSSSSSGRPSTAKPAEKFAWENADSIVAGKDEWLVKGLLPRVGVAVLAGISGGGKSFVMLDLCDRIARGQPVMGARRTVQSGLAYVAVEGANGVRKRLEGLRRRNGGWSNHVFLTADQLNLTEDESVNELRRGLESRDGPFSSSGIRLGMVIIDTLSAAIPGADENSAKDMSAILTRLQKLAVGLNTCVVLVAHFGKDASRGIRGWSGMLANVDSVLSIEPPDRDGVRTLKASKVKDGELGQGMPFKLEVITLGTDDEGDPITTCVVDWLPSDTIRQDRGRRRPLRPEQAAMLSTLKRLTDHGAGLEIKAAGAREGTVGVRQEVLRDAVDAGELQDEEPTEPAELRRWRDRKRKNFQNRAWGLREAGLIRLEDGMVWLVNQPAGMGTA